MSNEKVKLLMVGRNSGRVVEAKIGNKFITVGTERYTKRHGFGGAIGHRSSNGGFYSTNLYELDSEFAIKYLKETELQRKRNELMELCKKTAPHNIESIYDFVKEIGVI